MPEPSSYPERVTISVHPKRGIGVKPLESLPQEGEVFKAYTTQLLRPPTEGMEIEQQAIVLQQGAKWWVVFRIWCRTEEGEHEFFGTLLPAPTQEDVLRIILEDPTFAGVEEVNLFDHDGNLVCTAARNES